MHPVGRASPGERGIALVIALMFLFLGTVLAATFMTLASGERSMSSNVQVAKGALYAADAGIRIAEQNLANMARKKVDSLATLWTGAGTVIPNPGLLFPAGAIPVSGASPSFSSSATVSYVDNQLTDTTQAFNYLCTVTSTGSQGAVGKRRIQCQSYLRLSVSRGSFSDYLMFVNQFTMSDGGAIWLTSSANMDGRVHTNGEFRFAYMPQFQDLVTSANTKAWYYNNPDSPKELAANYNGTKDVPKFFGGFERGVTPITMPANDYNQQGVTLGQIGATTAPINSDINQALGLGTGITTAPPNGVYLVNNGASVTGGIYIQGTLDQCLMSVDASGNQVFTCKQGANTWTVTVKKSANATTIKKNAGGVQNYGGFPKIMYVNGTLSDLRGPDRVSGVPPPAIATNTEFLVAAKSDVVLQRDIVSQDFNANSSILGIYSTAGNVRVATGAPNDMQLDAMVMAAGASASFTVDDYKTVAPRGTFHLRGGITESFYGAFGTFGSNGAINHGYGRDFHYDPRGLVPPYFPATNRAVANIPTARTVVWKEI